MRMRRSGVLANIAGAGLDGHRPLTAERADFRRPGGDGERGEGDAGPVGNVAHVDLAVLLRREHVDRGRENRVAPIALRPGMTATRQLSALMERAMSSARPMTREDFTPGAGSSSNSVTTGPGRAETMSPCTP